MSMSPHNPPERSAAAPLRDVAEPGTSQELLDAIQSLGDRRILLIVDRGLVQFAKFVAAQIVIFGVVGLFLFGADVKDALQEVRETRDAVRASQQDLRQTEIELTDAKEGLREQQAVVASQLTQSVSAVDELHERVDQLQKEANRHLVQIRGLHTEAETIVVGIRQLTIQEQETGL